MVSKCASMVLAADNQVYIYGTYLQTGRIFDFILREVPAKRPQPAKPLAPSIYTITWWQIDDVAARAGILPQSWGAQLKRKRVLQRRR